MEHIDRLIEIFNVCWPMYAAMPAVLKDAVEHAYIAAGWNLENSECRYHDTHGNALYPSFIDVLNQIDNFINENLSITLIATLGGGVGSGSTKAIAEHLTNKNIIVKCILVKPFSWEGSKKSNRANETIEFLKQLKNVSIIEIENDELKSFEHLSMKESFNLLNNKINLMI